jgi:hypothetical protein
VTRKLFVVVAVLAFTSLSLLAQSTPSIQGVWRLVEVTITNPNVQYDSLPKGTHTNLQPALLIFTAKHYSFVGDTAAHPRPVIPFKVAGKPTAEEAIARWGPVVANSGTYEVSGNVITSRAIVNKASVNQGAGYFERATFKLDGNNLWMTSVENKSGKLPYPITAKYVRVE